MGCVSAVIWWGGGGEGALAGFFGLGLGRGGVEATPWGRARGGEDYYA